MKQKTIRCNECGKVYSSLLSNSSRWNSVFSKGVMTGALCPDCQTPEQNAEAEINAATLDYSTGVVDGKRVGITTPKVSPQDMQAAVDQMLDDALTSVVREVALGAGGLTLEDTVTRVTAKFPPFFADKFALPLPEVVRAYVLHRFEELDTRP